MTEDLQKLLDAATPGPWGWFGSPNELKLATTHSGREYVMDFVRKGFNGAQPRFQPTKRGMVPADKLLQFEVGNKTVRGEAEARADDSVYRYDVVGVDAPDARLIALAPTLARQVIAAQKLADFIAEFSANKFNRIDRRAADPQDDLDPVTDYLPIEAWQDDARAALAEWEAAQ